MMAFLAAVVSGAVVVVVGVLGVLAVAGCVEAEAGVPHSRAAGQRARRTQGPRGAGPPARRWAAWPAAGLRPERAPPAGRRRQRRRGRAGQPAEPRPERARSAEPAERAPSAEPAEPVPSRLRRRPPRGRSPPPGRAPSPP